MHRCTAGPIDEKRACEKEQGTPANYVFSFSSIRRRIERQQQHSFHYVSYVSFFTDSMLLLLRLNYVVFLLRGLDENYNYI